eukprot:symbB.v1.2.021649.t1/scaffold1746.1/size103363/7
MRDIQELVAQELEEQEEEELLDCVSDGDGEPLDSLEAPVKLDDSFPSTIFIAGVPKVSKEKYDKLFNVLSKLINKYGDNEKDMPYNPEGTETEGCVIVTFSKPEEATNAWSSTWPAQQALDGMSLDKKHTFKVVKMDDFNRITSRASEFRAQRNLASYSRSDFRTWLTDKKCREQFLLRYQTETEIYWHDTTIGEPDLCYGGEREKRTGKIWCDWQVQWSPLGHFLATFHKQGVALWAGPEFTKKIRFAHDGVKHLEFSPTEEYALTWNGTGALENDPQAVRIHRVLTGECVHKCRTPTVAPLGGDFPHFLWSYDGKYFAECNESAISVRETASFELIKDEEGKKKTMKFPDLSTFQWSPKDNLLSVWCLEQENNPARLVLVEIPSRRELASRSRTQAPQQDKEERSNKSGDFQDQREEHSSGYRGGERFRAHRFSLLTSDDSGHHPKMFIYGLSKEKCEALSFFDLPSNSYNNFFWAPEGQYFVCAAVGHGDLLFGGMTSDNKLEILHKDEHFMLTDVQWDPYVITAVTQPMQNEIGGFKYSMEAGFAIWTFQGRVLHRQQKEKLWQISWRPHPPCLLSTAKQSSIRKNVKQYSKKYDHLDDQAKEAARNAFKNERETKMRDFKDVLARLDEYKFERSEENQWDEAAPGSAGLGANGCEEPGSY